MNSKAKCAARCCIKVLLIRMKGLGISSHSHSKPIIMKTFLLCIAASFFIASCSTNPMAESASVILQEDQSQIVDDNLPGNLSNPFDGKGKNFFEEMNKFYQDNKMPKTNSEVGNQIRFISERFGPRQSNTGRLIPFTDEMVESLMADPDNIMIQIVQNSSLQSYAKGNLITFLQSLISKRQEEFSITYNYITNYEADVLLDTVLTSEETETILTVASISRYSLYSAEERKDKDWDILVGSKPAKALFTDKDISIALIIAMLNNIL